MAQLEQSNSNSTASLARSSAQNGTSLNLDRIKNAVDKCPAAVIGIPMIIKLILY